jgi:hypothetical protein
MTTTLNPHLPPATFAQDVVKVLGDHLAGLVDGHGTVAAIHFLGLTVKGRALHEWLAIGFAAVDVSRAELDASNAALREFPRQAEATRTARSWHADRQMRLRYLIGDLS